MPVVKFFACLDLDQNSSFLDGHYLIELTRYIHLNPLSAGIVKDLAALDGYRFAGHSVIMENQKATWQDDRKILDASAKTRKAARGPNVVD